MLQKEENSINLSEREGNGAIKQGGFHQFQ